MQVQKADIRTLILSVARDEFIRHGVKNTSIRTISQLSGVAVGNIYNYFKNKDDILKTVLAPLLQTFESYLIQSQSQTYITVDLFEYDRYFDMMKKQVDSLIKPYREELHLLLTNTAGTSLQNYLDIFTQRMMDSGLRYIQTMKRKYPHINANVSPHFVQALCELWKAVLKEIITHPAMNESEIDKLIADYVNFGIGGWKKLLEI
ncbi:TetR/AcrR family transcriptional regulator [Hoylesella enoeca]|uniref:TetR family transcriptional regulator n=1 Tax=Hoylesella enoeca TaxID=76123 RepID=A0A0S2KK95_9BACT|nr:TetR/AcrR family transcriptional regulator [Hoylesella enoeca]ALO48700.1 TetR family transcriptional regulator [Hoylesella enoeca]